VHASAGDDAHAVELKYRLGRVLETHVGRAREAVAHYRDRNWDQAIRLFKEVIRANPADRPSSLYLERCEIYRKTPPPANWDGVWSLKTD
jgi:adenylate cyclase